MTDTVSRIRSRLDSSAAWQRVSAFARRGNTPWLLAAIAVGFLLFLLMWGHNRKQFFTVEPVAKTDVDQEYAPLPTPTPGGSITDTPAGGPSPDSGNRPHLLEPPKPPPVAKAPPPAETAPPANVANANHGANTANATTAAVPISQPPPAYPRAAMQMSREGRVRVRVDIGVDGVPTDSSLVESSGDRDLDRAALQAVRRWRFKPATAHGAPVASNVTVSIEFRLSQ